MGWSKAKRVHIRRLVGFTTIVLTALLYTASLWLPAARFDTDHPTMSPAPGYVLILAGPFLMLVPDLLIFWLTNPVLWVGFTAAVFTQWLLAFCCGLLATACGLGTLLIYDPYSPVPPRGSPMLSGSLPSRVTEFGPGYFCWVGSAACLSLGACAILLIDSRHDEFLLFELLEKPRPLIGKEDFGLHSDL